MKKLPTRFSAKDPNAEDALAKIARVVNTNIGPIEWHYVGQSGEPAFKNSWGNVGDPYQVARFGKYPNGELWIEGRITGGAINTVAWTNPIGYRPPKKMVFYVVLAGTGHVEVDTNGDVKIVS